MEGTGTGGAAGTGPGPPLVTAGAAATAAAGHPLGATVAEATAAAQQDLRAEVYPQGAVLHAQPADHLQGEPKPVLLANKFETSSAVCIDKFHSGVFLVSILRANVVCAGRQMVHPVAARPEVLLDHLSKTDAIIRSFRHPTRLAQLWCASFIMLCGKQLLLAMFNKVKQSAMSSFSCFCKWQARICLLAGG